MLKKKILIIFLLIALFGVSIQWTVEKLIPNLSFNRKDLKSRLTPLQYYVTQRGGTERRGSEYVKTFQAGNYNCIVCNERLFISDNKYKSKHNRVAFVEKTEQVKVITHYGTLHKYNELLCTNCGAHLGECYYDDEEKILGINQKHRYYVNSAAIKFAAETDGVEDVKEIQ